MAMTLGQQLTRKKPIATADPGGHQGVHGGPDLGRTIGTFQLMMFGVGATVGTGIFFVLPESVPDAGPAVVVAFLLAGLAAGLSAICYAEMASSIPVSGSTYSYAYHSMGELVAMIIAACVILEYGVAAGAVAVGWSGYFNELLDKTIGWSLPDALSYSPIPVEDGTPGLVNLPAIVLVFLCTLLLIRGASESAKVNTVMVLIKLSVLGLFIVIGLSAFQADRFDNFWASGSAGITAAAGTIFFSFIGLDAVSTAGEEVKDPQRALPRAILGALVIVVTVYVLVAIAGVGAQPLADFSSKEQQDAGLSVIMENVTGSAVPGTILAAGAVISIFSVTLVTLYGQTRILFAMGRDGMLPPFFHRVNPRTLTPVNNTIVVAVVVGLLAGLLPINFLAEMTSIGTLVAFLVVSIGVMVLRRTAPDLPRGFKVPGYPVTPILSIIGCLWIIKDLRAVTLWVFVIWTSVVLAWYFLYGIKHSHLGRHEHVGLPHEDGQTP